MLRRTMFCLAFMTTLTACDRKAETQPPAAEAVRTAAAPVTPAAAPLTGAQVYKMRCVVCHGETGKGNGAGAAALTVKPRDYTDAAWQKVVTDDQIKAIIVKGGGAVGKDPGMPPNPDLADKESVVEELVKIVRSFAPAP